MKRYGKSRVLCAVLSLLMVLSVCSALSVSAATFSATKVSGHVVTPGVEFSKFSIQSVNGNKVSGAGLTFDPGEYLFLAFGGAAGTSLTVDGHYKKAVAMGYEVVGAINGSFCSMGSDTWGTLNEFLVSNGVMISGVNDDSAAMFGTTSSGELVDIPSSRIRYTMTFNGEQAGTLYGINRNPSNKKAESWSTQYYYFDEYCGKAMTYDFCPGYEILCEKQNGTEVVIDGTLEGKVLSVKENSYGTKPEKGQFLLFVRANSPYATEAAALKAGDAVEITATEMVPEAKGITSQMTSMIANIGYLVKDGVNLVEQASFNSTDPHGNTYKSSWTAVGITEEGKWLFFTTDGYNSGANMKDVAQAMVEQYGCKTVIRMDGGGSVQMYLSNTGNGSAGYAMNYSANESYHRPVGDCILVVRRTGAASDADLKTKLQALTDASASKTGAYTDAVAQARAVLAQEKATTADFRRAYMTLNRVSLNYSKLDEVLAAAKNADIAVYAPTSWKRLEAAIAAGEAAKKNGNLTVTELADVVKQVTDALAATGDLKENVALGCSYTVSLNANAGYPDTNKTELTDGDLASATDGHSPGWSGYNNPSNPVVTVDLGSTVKGLREFNVHALSIYSWGIVYPSKVVVHVSNDNKTFTKVGEVAPSLGKDEGGAYDFTVKLDEDVSARYVRFSITGGGAFTFISEVEAIRYEAVRGDVIMGDVTGDTKVNARDYFMLKQFVLNIAQPTAAQLKAGDMDGNGKLQAKDYFMLKMQILSA